MMVQIVEILNEEKNLLDKKPSGEGYFRLTAFGTRENTKKAIERIIEIYA